MSARSIGPNLLCEETESGAGKRELGWFQVAREQDQDARHWGGVPWGEDLGSEPKASVVELPGCPVGGLPLSLGKEWHS